MYYLVAELVVILLLERQHGRWRPLLCAVCVFCVSRPCLGSEPA